MAPSAAALSSWTAPLRSSSSAIADTLIADIMPNDRPETRPAPVRRGSDVSSTISSPPFTHSDLASSISGSELELDFSVIDSDEVASDMADSGMWERTSAIFGDQEHTITQRGRVPEPMNLSLFFPDPHAASTASLRADAPQHSMQSSQSTVVPTSRLETSVAQLDVADEVEVEVQPIAVFTGARPGLSRNIALASIFAVVAVVMGGLGASLGRGNPGKSGFETAIATVTAVMAVSTHVVSHTTSASTAATTMLATCSTSATRRLCDLSVRPHGALAIRPIEAFSRTTARLRRRQRSTAVPKATQLTHRCDLSTAIAASQAGDLVRQASMRALAALAIVQSSEAYQQTLAVVLPIVTTSWHLAQQVWRELIGPFAADIVDSLSPLWTGVNASKASVIGHLSLDARRNALKLVSQLKAAQRPGHPRDSYFAQRFDHRRQVKVSARSYASVLSSRARRIFNTRLRPPVNYTRIAHDPLDVWMTFGF